MQSCMQSLPDARTERPKSISMYSYLTTPEYHGHIIIGLINRVNDLYIHVRVNEKYITTS